MSAPATSRKDACKLVKSIAEDHGYVHEDDWNLMPSAVRERVQKALRNLEGIAAVAVSTLAKNLYTSDARFVFELLQNAEDNSFEKAIEANLTPYVSFELHPDHIIIECNEDGFEPKNLKAICAVGQSSKSGVQKGYVGEKGIGFKSVFMAAWKVHIKSGHFSFFFQHKRGDQGLGMISPVWEEPENDQPHPGTQMKLELGDGYTPIPSSQYQIILDQFSSLNESILLFMRNLGEIRISIFDNEGNLEKSNTFSKERINANLTRLTKVSKTANNVDSSFKDYYIFKHTVGNLDKNENRTYSEYEEKTKAYATAEIVLGFPLTEESIPIVEYQDIFAFLPMKEVGFTFLINSDFVTQANRQDIVTTSSRNIGIRQGIADAFIQAILEFCNHPKLQYTWMRFLPNKDQHFDAFWSQLVTLLDDKLKETAVLRPRSETTFRLISSLRYSVDSQLDRHGEPLFRDNNPEMHISKHYAKEDVNILRNFYGLTEYTASEILLAISLDLGMSDSRMKSEDMDDDWHTRSANYLSYVYLTGDASIRSKLRSLPFLPLQDEKWIAAANHDVFFSEAGSLDVPPELDLNIIIPKASQNVHRRQLFSRLGVKEAEVSFLRRLILNRGTKMKWINSSVKQLKYMFLTDKHKQNSEDSGNIWIGDSNNTWRRTHHVDVFMPDNKPFGPSKLLEEAKDIDNLSVKFIHPLYINGVFDDDASSLTSWKNWLCSYAGVRRHVRIISKEKRNELSNECLYVAKNHADKFLGFLNYSWGQESKDIESSPALIKRLKEIQVPCHGGLWYSIGSTWLPLPNLQTAWERFSRGHETFPLLKLDREVTRESYAKDWGFLVSSLGVGTEEDLDFYLSILYHIVRDFEDEGDEDIYDLSRIFELYGVIYGKYIASSDNATKDKIRYLLYVPWSKYPYTDRPSPAECVWDGPKSLTIKAPLLAIYKAIPVENLSTITPFFTEVLGIGNYDEKILCDQLDDLRESGSNDFDRIKSLYISLRELLGKKTSNETRELIRNFASKALIYTKSDECWNTVSQCLWSCATTIRSKKVLESDYKEMRSFFVGILGVETLNLGLIYTELSKLGESTPTVELVKEQLFAFRDHLNTIRDYPDVKPDLMRKFKIFPVRQPGINQNIQFCDGNAEFAIADRRPLEDNFRQKIRTLGFTFDEIHALGPVIRWLGLEERYLSRLVTETSKVEESDRVLNYSLSRNIESRARALCRVAKHFNSPKWRTTEEFQELYDMLKKAKVFETDKISCLQIVQQGGKQYSHEISRSEFHLEETDVGLDIFVPQEKKSQALCLARALPARLFEWMTTVPSTKNSSSINDRSHSLVKDILKEDSDIYNQILLAEGIVDIDIEDEDVSDEEDSTTASSARGEASETYGSTEFGSNMATPLTDISSPRMDFDQDEILPTVAHQAIIGANSRFASSRSATRVLIQETPSNASAGNIELSTSIRREAISASIGYTGLLSQVVSAARRASFPTKGIFDLDALRESLPSVAATNSNLYETDGSEFNSALGLPQMERDKMIGAAGELYVFELLKACNPSLPNFGVDNWKSRIRSYARKHPEYATMEPWHGIETSDLVYHDSMGAFTKLLIDKCYFDASTWGNRRPKYHFEVKTTASSCETRFFVSKKQYKMVRAPQLMYFTGIKC
ncbi:uncharacterized protein TRIVIDRAFT_47475 [Trichoderma virens Gv29-8]|uniref:Protein NO VEIN C-terminal domain-containing protein n=1 Tax=Hypocrea virens (strain Gv29-8 / FGSC 10586) TaxID=413071 RepID=G9N417_HYPVG|nr:uncharacterized protein TRIVIDRAFT_47475 [Trichoderma virens Gv29-8]EHK18343.1 hypothetical protein TRIVIDRAFT_47475 [Trichoderma virens Gv29-8]